MSEPFRFERPGRNFDTLAALALGLGFAALALWHGAPAILWVPLGLCLAMAGYMVVFSPGSGMEIDAGRWRIWAPGARLDLPVAEVERVMRKDWTDSTDWEVWLRGAKKPVRLPDRAIPPAPEFATALGRLGIPVQDRN